MNTRMTLALAAADLFPSSESEQILATAVRKLSDYMGTIIDDNDPLIDVIADAIAENEDAAFVQGFLTGINFILNQ